MSKSSEHTESAIPGIYEELPIDKVFENSWNYKAMSENMFNTARASIREHGFILPVVVREVATMEGDTGYEIIDGAHRLKAARIEGYTTIPVINLGDVSIEEAKVKMISLNEIHGDSQDDVLKGLLTELAESDSLPEGMLGSLPYTPEYFDALTKGDDVTGLDAPEVPYDGDGGGSNSSSTTKDADEEPLVANVQVRCDAEHWKDNKTDIIKEVKDFCATKGLTVVFVEA